MTEATAHPITDAVTAGYAFEGEKVVKSAAFKQAMNTAARELVRGFLRRR